MSEEGAARRKERCNTGRAMPHDQHSRDALQRIKEKRSSREILAPGAQNIRRADIAGSNATQIGRARHASQQKTDWTRAAEIAEDKREEAGSEIGQEGSRTGEKRGVGKLAGLRRGGNGVASSPGVVAL